MVHNLNTFLQIQRKTVMNNIIGYANRTFEKMNGRYHKHELQKNLCIVRPTCQSLYYKFLK